MVLNNDSAARGMYAIPVNGNRYKAHGKLDDRATIRRAN